MSVRENHIKTWPAGLATRRTLDSVPVLSHHQAHAHPSPTSSPVLPQMWTMAKQFSDAPLLLVLIPKARQACTMGADFWFPSSELARCHCEHPAVNPVVLGVPLLWVQIGLGQDWVPGWAEWC